MTIAQDHPNDQLALDAFLNAALREGRLEAARFDEGRFVFRDPKGREVAVPVRARSRFRCLFSGPVSRRENGVHRPLPVATLLDDLAGAGGPVFRDRVLDSLAAIRRAPAARPDAESWSFIEAEQALKAGHPFHPNPRSREGMSPEDAAQYAPELEGRFTVLWLHADMGMVAAGPGSVRRLAELAASDGAAPATDGTVPIPWHPWQAERLLAQEDVREQLEARRLAVLGPGRGEWAATSSMRSITHGTRPSY